jgi:uncharacterized membrane protein YbaN (DUF454 family)
VWDKVKKHILLMSGFIVLGIGLVGVFVPLLPTTPFVLLAAWFFARSSRKYHLWLRSNRYFGETLRAWESGQGLTVKEKWRMVIVATVFIGISFLVCPNAVGRIVLLLVWPIPISVAIFTKTRK